MDALKCIENATPAMPCHAMGVLLVVMYLKCSHGPVLVVMYLMCSHGLVLLVMGLCLATCML